MKRRGDFPSRPFFMACIYQKRLDIWTTRLLKNFSEEVDE